MAVDGYRFGLERGIIQNIELKLRLDRYGGVFLLLQERSKHPQRMVMTPEASSSRAQVIARRTQRHKRGRGRPFLSEKRALGLGLKVLCAPK